MWLHLQDDPGATGCRRGLCNQLISLFFFAAKVVIAGLHCKDVSPDQTPFLIGTSEVQFLATPQNFKERSEQSQP
jgi:hypothetical protein